MSDRWYSKRKAASLSNECSFREHVLRTNCERVLGRPTCTVNKQFKKNWLLQTIHYLLKKWCSMQYSFEKRQPSSTVLFLLNTCNWDAQYIAWWATGPFHVAWEQPSAKVSHELGSWPNRQLKINREKDKTNVLYVYKYTWILHKIGHPDNIYIYIYVYKYMHMIIYCESEVISPIICCC